jgi:hypothetical protein
MHLRVRKEAEKKKKDACMRDAKKKKDACISD